MTCLHISSQLRNKLKQPFGLLLKHNEISRNNLLKHISRSFLITIGDATTEKLLYFNIIPEIQIIDNIEQRSARHLISDKYIMTNIHCNNPPGCITKQSIDVIKSAFNLVKPIRITIHGEEDLLTLPICIHAPNNSTVLYGQPNEGIVIIKINAKTRYNAQLLLDLMN